jgi:thioredoxin-related protein
MFDLKMLFRYSLLFAVLFLIQGAKALAQDKINWISFEEAIEKNKEENKKMFIDVYTDWCGWCKKMDRTTFRNPVIVDYINSNYLPVKFNAEQKVAIEFKGEEYNFIRKGRRGYHELAAAITKGQLSYPTYVFLDENLNVIQPVPGYQDEVTFEYILNYFGDDFYKKVPWKQFTKEYQPQNKKK